MAALLCIPGKGMRGLWCYDALTPTHRKTLFVGYLCSLHSVFVDIERHASEPGVPASGVNSLRTFHTGKVIALTCLRPLSNEMGESGGVLITGGG